MADLKNKKYLSLKEAAEIFGYSPDYIGYLIRTGKIKGKKIYRDIIWQTTEKEIIKYCNLEARDYKMKRKFISLKEAADISGYAPDYIGYLIRRGKIKGQKVYSQTSWLVKKEEIERYQILKKRKILKRDDEKKFLIFGIPSISWKVFNVGWRLALTIFIIFSFVSGFAPIRFLENSIGAFFIEETKTVNFYTTLCDGEWQNPQNAEGSPDVLSIGDINSFSEVNSAVYKTGPLSLICQDFKTSEEQGTPAPAVSDLGAGQATSTSEVIEEATSTEVISIEGEQQPATSTSQEATTTPPTQEEQGTVEEEATTTEMEATTTEATLTEATTTFPEVTTTEATPYQSSTSSDATGQATTESEGEPTSFLNKAKKFFGFQVHAQENTFLAKIKFSFAIGEKEPDISIIEQPAPYQSSTSSDSTGQATSSELEINSTSSEGQTGFWNKIKNFFGSLVAKVASIARAQEGEQNATTTTTTETIVEVEPRTDETTTTVTTTTVTTTTTTEATPYQSSTSSDAAGQATTSETIISDTTTTTATTTEISETEPQVDETTTTTEATTTEATTTEATTTEATTTETITETLPNLDTKIIIWYSLDGINWQILDTISSHPLSNALNGGYFEYDAPFLQNFEDVNNLKIKFEGVVGGETNVTAYLDSIWVEVTYKEQKVKEEEKQQPLLESEVELELTSEGRKVFVLEKEKNEKYKISLETEDNLNPNINEDKNFIVWQGEVTGKWQIFFAKRKPEPQNVGEEIIAFFGNVVNKVKDIFRDSPPAIPWEVQNLTNASYSNIEPKISGNYIIWQGWPKEQWEIFFFDGQNIRQLTNNIWPDTLPQISGDWITWEGYVEEDESLAGKGFLPEKWEIFLYHIPTGQTFQVTQNNIKDSQPRFEGDQLIWQSGGKEETINLTEFLLFNPQH